MTDTNKQEENVRYMLYLKKILRIMMIYLTIIMMIGVIQTYMMMLKI